MTEPINGTASRPSITERLRRRLPWSDWDRAGELEETLSFLRGAREYSIGLDEQHRATCDDHADHALVYQLDGEGIDRLITTLEGAQTQLRWFRRHHFRAAVVNLVVLALGAASFALAMVNLVCLVW